MGFQIQDGTGSSRRAKVTEKNSLSVQGTFRTEAKEGSLNGDAFLVSSGYITYTVATAVGVLYLENNEDVPLVLDRFNFNLNTSTGGAVAFGRFIFYRNPTGITNGTVGTSIVNLNFGSSDTLDISFEIGNGSTSAITGGTAFGSPLIPIGEVTFIDGNVIIPKGGSLGIAYIAPPSNTSQSVAVGLNFYRAE